MPDPALRRATPADLPALAALEHACFEPERRASRASLRRSLHSPRQHVWVLTEGRDVVASMVLWNHARTLRIHGLAVRPSHQGAGLGWRMIRHAEAQARRAGVDRVVLEADAHRPVLLAWYERLGYRRVALWRDYYAPGRAAWRMERRVAGDGSEGIPS